MAGDTTVVSLLPQGDGEKQEKVYKEPTILEVHIEDLRGTIDLVHGNVRQAIESGPGKDYNGRGMWLMYLIQAITILDKHLVEMIGYTYAEDGLKQEKFKRLLELGQYTRKLEKEVRDGKRS